MPKAETETGQQRKWCPWARVSIHMEDHGIMRAIPAGAFNQAIRAEDSDRVHLVSFCIGEQCALYRKRMFSRHGFCGGGPKNYDGLIIFCTVMLTVSMGLIAYFLR